MTDARGELLALADDYEAGLKKMEVSGYEEFDGPRRTHRIVIDALRAQARAAPARCDAESAELTEAMLEAGAQALANDVWHPPQPLASLSPLDSNKFRRQALLALKAALSPDPGTVA